MIVCGGVRPLASTLDYEAPGVAAANAASIEHPAGPNGEGGHATPAAHAPLSHAAIGQVKETREPQGHPGRGGQWRGTYFSEMATNRQRDGNIGSNTELWDLPAQAHALP
jgi:hypothetical protein